MKINLIRTANNKFWPAEQEDLDLMKKLKVGDYYSAEIRLQHNYPLLQKIHVFFKYCTKFYFGSETVDKDQVAYCKKNLLIAAGYSKTMVDPRTGHIEITAKSISYEKMKEEDRRDCYQKLITAACENVFHECTQERWNDLSRFF